MKQIHIKRLRKLIAFLDALPRKRFNFAIVRNEPPKCGAVGCAIGYMPNVFPRTFRSFPVPKNEKDIWTHGVGFRKDGYISFEEVGMWVSGLDFYEAGHLFNPWQQSFVHPELKDLPETATPKQVARMLEKFIKLQMQSK
jgi:hypothetical protein